MRKRHSGFGRLGSETMSDSMAQRMPRQEGTGMRIIKSRTLRLAAVLALLAAGPLATASGIALAGTASGPAVAGTASPGGTRLWTERFPGGTGQWGQGLSEAVSPDQPVVYVTGITLTTSSGMWDFGTVAYDSATGATLWTAHSTAWHITAGNIVSYPAVSVSPDGSMVFVVGQFPRAGHFSYLITAYDAATGAQLWTAQPSGLATLPVHPVTVSPDSATVYVTSNPGGAIRAGYKTVAYNTATGAPTWSATTRFPQVFNPSVDDVTMAPDGSAVFVTGDAGTVAYDATTGATLWLDHYQQSSDWHPVGMAASPDSSRIYITTQASTSGCRTGNTCFRMAAYDAATGTSVWTHRFLAATSGNPVGMALSPDGSRLFVTTQPDLGNFAIIGYAAASGARLWTANGPGTGQQGNQPADLAVSPAGSELIETGFTSTGNYDEYMTVSYDPATGAQRWLKYAKDTPARNTFSRASAVTFSPDGTQVFVTGSDASAHSGQYLTVAYRA
jgi:WD40 repeat protein